MAKALADLPSEFLEQPVTAPAQYSVRCPYCQTKFAVQKNLIEDLGCPRFHCSRCDNIFSKELDILDRTFPTSPPTPTPLTDVKRDPEDQLEFSFELKKDLANGEGIYIDEVRPAEPVYETRVSPSPVAMPTARSVSGWRSYLLLASPMILTLICLFMLSVYLVSNMDFAENVYHSLRPSAPLVAPPGLQIKELDYQQVTLENGSLLPLISGTIINNSDEEITDIQIEGVLFNRDGRKLRAEKAEANPALLDTELPSLTMDMITEIQHGNQQKPALLAPQETRRFALTLPEAPLSEARFYAARVYSVVK